MAAYMSLKPVMNYRDIMFNGLKNSFPGLTKDEMYEAIDWSIDNRITNAKAVLDNNYTKQRVDATVLDVLQYIQKLEPIVTSSGVLFKKHKEADNPLVRMVINFLDQRAKFKKEMFKYPKGSELFERYNLFQLLKKRDANAAYGCLGNETSMFYNIYVAEAVTRQGRSYIAASITFFEAFLANNMKFNSVDEIIQFCEHVKSEKANRKCIDKDILDRNITREECFFKLMTSVDMMIWQPTERQEELVWEYVLGLDQEDLNRIYYKNNLYTFCDLPLVSQLIVNILSKLGGEVRVVKKDDKYKYDFNLFLDPNSPPESVKDDLDVLLRLVKEYVYYPHFFIDKLDRIEYTERDVVAIVDTDSCILSFDAWYRFILSKVYNIDLPLKHQKYDMCHILTEDEFGDKDPRKMCEIVEPEFDYDFYTDETIETHKLIEMCKLVPQDNLRYSIINIIAYICSDLIIDYMAEYTKLTGSYVEGVKCRMIMKNEYLFSRLLLTGKIRNYAAFMELQEGHKVPKKAGLSIAGLQIDKSTLQDEIKDEFKRMLYEDIMTSDNIDQIKLLKKMVILESRIHESIMNKETKYYKPGNVGAMNTYENPMSENGIVASIFYNEMRHDNEPELNLEERNAIIKIKLNVSKKNADLIKDDYPEDYENLMRVLDNPILGKKVNTLGLPMDVPVPDWVLPFVDYNDIISDSLKLFPLESIGINRLDNDNNVNYSNMVSF